MDSYVERRDLEVLRVRADMKGKGPGDAFQRLEATLPSLQGRNFYGSIRLLEDGEEYYACVERAPGDDAEKMGLETATLPGGLYVRRKLFDWEKLVAGGKLPEASRDLAESHDIDRSRPELEYYRSHTELHILLPVLSRNEHRTAPM